ncbi:MAG: hypothetical protein HEQ16_13695 [Bosea sp.]|nr:hypothetical protein [Bosea sp. (in: a-proteobacteria)]
MMHEDSAPTMALLACMSGIALHTQSQNAVGLGNGEGAGIRPSHAFAGFGCAVTLCSPTESESAAGAVQRAGLEVAAQCRSRFDISFKGPCWLGALPDDTQVHTLDTQACRMAPVTRARNDEVKTISRHLA